jgi:uncharacterized membrane protein
MKEQLDDYRAELVNKILFAASDQEVKELIYSAMKLIEQKNSEKDLIARFLEKITQDLNSFSPMKKEAQQWSHIKLARILFNRLKNAAPQTL